MTVFEKFIDSKNGGPSLALPVALLSIGFLTAIGFQTVQLMGERSNLASVYVGQENAVEQTLRLRNSVDAFAGETATLAQQGNGPAKRVVETLRGQNITIRPPAAASVSVPMP
ncbi:MAG TPA: hypothetical protein VGF92_17605 [Stellaceae bacterium]|jgi:hypothetical protein